MLGSGSQMVNNCESLPSFKAKTPTQVNFDSPGPGPRPPPPRRLTRCQSLPPSPAPAAPPSTPPQSRHQASQGFSRRNTQGCPLSPVGRHLSLFPRRPSLLLSQVEASAGSLSLPAAWAMCKGGPCNLQNQCQSCLKQIVDILYAWRKRCWPIM